MTQVVFSSRSRRDLDEILELHADRNPRYAIELNQQLCLAANSLSANSKRGAPMRTRRREIRRLIVNGHIILYSYESVVTILRVLHGARDVAAIAADLT